MDTLHVQTLLTLSRTIATVRQREPLLRILIEQLQPAFGFYDCGLFVFNPDKTALEDWAVSIPTLSPSEANTRLAKQNAATISYQGSVWELMIDQLQTANAPVLHDYSEPLSGWQSYVQAPVLEEVGYQESLLALMQMGGDKLGVFAINSLERGHFQESQFRFFQQVTDQIAVAVANLLATENILEHDRQKSTLLSISGAISSARNAVELLSVIREGAQQLIPFYDTGILIVEPDGQHHYDLAVRLPGWDSSEVNQQLQTEQLDRVPHKDSYLAYVIQQINVAGTPIIEDWEVAFEQFSHPFFPILKKGGYKQALVTTLKAGGKTIGTLWLNSLEKNHFHTSQFDICQALADQVAVAVANILANEEVLQREREKDVLLKITQAIAAVNDKVTLLRTIFDLVQPVFQFDDLGLAILSPDKQHITDWSAGTPGLSDSSVNANLYAQQLARMDYPGTLLEHTIEQVEAQGHPLLIELTEALAGQWPDAVYLPLEIKHGQKECLFTNLKTGGQLLGSFNVNCKQAGYLATTDHALFQAIADQIAVAVANIQAKEEILEREREKTHLLRISEAICRINHRGELLRVIYQQIQPIFSFENAGLFITDLEKDLLYEILDSEALPDTLQQQLTEQHWLGPWQLSISNPDSWWMQDEIVVRSLAEEALLAQGHPGESQFNAGLAFGLKQMIGGPLYANGKKIGALCFNSVKEQFFTSAHQPMFKNISEQVGVAIANILANEEIREREQERSLLLSISQQLSTIRNQEDLFDTFIHQLNNQLPFDEALVVLYDEACQTRRYLYNHLPPPKNTLSDYQHLLRDRLPVNGSPYEEIVTYKQPQIRTRLYWEARYPNDLGLRIARDNGLREGLYMPLYYQSQLLGTFVLHSGQSGRFTQAQLPLYSNLADQVAVAVANVLANEEILQREREKALQLAVIDTLTNGQDWTQKLLAMARVIQPHVPFDYASVSLPTNSQTHHGYHFYRTGYDEYQTIATDDFLRLSGLTAGQYVTLQQQRQEATSLLLTGPDFRQYGQTHELTRSIGQTFRLQSHLLLPIPLTRAGHFVLAFYSRQPDSYHPSHLDLLTKLQQTIALTLDRLLAYEEVETLSRQLKQENTYLQEEVRINYRFEEIVGTSQALRDVFEKVSKVGPMSSTVLILGETGTGKELVARAIHQASPRHHKPLIKINCAALPAQLIESELFGHEKGAFTGAIDRRIGKFELAHESTIFLDEIGELPLELQAKLLRAIQEKEIERLGSNKVIQTNVRVLAATNRNLEKEVAEGRFRSDLYFRLNVYPIKLPPLRERKEDIPLLAIHFTQKLSKKLGKSITGLSNGAINEMQSYHWPGNIRELEHVIERAAIESVNGLIKNLALRKRAEDAPTPIFNPVFQLKSYADGERDLIMNTLRACNGRIRGEGGAAQLLKIKATTLEARMKKLGIKREFFITEPTSTR